MPVGEVAEGTAKLLDYGATGVIVFLVLVIAAGTYFFVRTVVKMNKQSVEIIEKNTSSHIQLTEAIKSMKESQEKSSTETTAAMQQLTIEVIKKKSVGDG